MTCKLALILALTITFCTACASQAAPPSEASSDLNPASGLPIEPTPLFIDIEGAIIEGDPAAKVIIVEFMDYQCPVCARHVREIMPQLRENYIDTGKAAYVYMDFPIERWHLLAFQAAEAVHCAADQGQFREMRDLLLSRQRELQEDNLYAHADSLSLDMSTFQECMSTNQHAASIRHSVEVGESLNIKGTPSFFFSVPETGQPGVVRVVDRSRGVSSYPPFERKLGKVLDSAQ